MIKTDKTSILLFSVYTFVLLFVVYFVDRVSDKFFNPFSFEIFFGCIGLLFALMFYLFKTNTWNFNLKEFIGIGIVLRLILFLAEPNLSDDYFRFIWDGTLTKNGINPFLYLPSEIIKWDNAESLGFTQELYNGFNSQNYYSVYPPVNQFVFFMSAWLGNGDRFISVLVLRLFMIAAEFGSIFFLGKLLLLQNRSLKYLWLYILNPLILLEFTVNLHFEALMVCFLLGAIYYLKLKKITASALFWTLAIYTKLIPIVYLIFVIKKLKFKQLIQFGSITVLSLIILLLPFWNESIVTNIQDSVDKYFGYFEFNAGIPYLIREIGYLYYDYSILFRVMPVVKKVFIVFVLLYGLIFFIRKKSIDTTPPIYWTAFVYFLLAGILHPWYITLLIPLGILSKNYSGLVWSFLIFLSYSAYKSSVYAENYWLVGIEFSLLGFILIYLGWKKVWQKK